MNIYNLLFGKLCLVLMNVNEALTNHKRFGLTVSHDQLGLLTIHECPAQNWPTTSCDQFLADDWSFYPADHF